MINENENDQISLQDKQRKYEDHNQLQYFQFINDLRGQEEKKNSMFGLMYEFNKIKKKGQFIEKPLKIFTISNNLEGNNSNLQLNQYNQESINCGLNILDYLDQQIMSYNKRAFVDYSEDNIPNNLITIDSQYPSIPLYPGQFKLPKKYDHKYHNFYDIYQFLKLKSQYLLSQNQGNQIMALAQEKENNSQVIERDVFHFYEYYLIDNYEGYSDLEYKCVECKKIQDSIYDSKNQSEGEQLQNAHSGSIDNSSLSQKQTVQIEVVKESNDQRATNPYQMKSIGVQNSELLSFINFDSPILVNKLIQTSNIKFTQDQGTCMFPQKEIKNLALINRLQGYMIEQKQQSSRFCLDIDNSILQIQVQNERKCEQERDNYNKKNQIEESKDIDDDPKFHVIQSPQQYQRFQENQQLEMEKVNLLENCREQNELGVFIQISQINNRENNQSLDNQKVSNIKNKQQFNAKFQNRVCGVREKYSQSKQLNNFTPTIEELSNPPLLSYQHLKNQSNSQTEVFYNLHDCSNNQNIIVINDLYLAQDPLPYHIVYLDTQTIQYYNTN
eukprot:403372665